MVIVNCLVALCVVFFFFQAEDGIRDLTVTGVQTCALPISGTSTRTPAASGGSREGAVWTFPGAHDERRRAVVVTLVLYGRPGCHLCDDAQIGRASCRERV